MAFDVHWFPTHISLVPGEQATGNDIVETLKLIWKDERFNGSLHQIWDFTKTKDFTIKTVDLQKINVLTQNNCMIDSSVCLAIVAPNPSVYYRMQALVSYTNARLFNSRVFSSLEKAQYWLNVDPQQEIPMH